MVPVKNKVKHIIFLSVIVFTILYAITRITFTIINSAGYSNIEIIVSFLLLFSETFLLTHAIGYGRHLIQTINIKKEEDIFIPSSEEIPSVAILVAARHEPKEVLEQTFRSITNIRYPNKKIYFLDDSSEEKYKKEAEELCENFGLTLFRRTERHGAKAGIINDCLKQVLTEKYIAIFDADQNPVPSFLNPIIRILEYNKKLAFVQTPQFYYNSDHPVAHGSTFQQAIFYEYICESKGKGDAMFCCGTNVVFRKEALVDVDGFDEKYVTEDIATSLKLHMKGWQSKYYNHVGAFGMGPESLAEYFKQQARWSRGNFGLLRKIIYSFLTKPRSMTISQWIEYLLSGTYYLVGVSFLFLLICPILYLLFNIPTFFISYDIYLSVFIPYFTLSLSVFYITLQARNYKTKDLFLGQMLTYISFPIYIKSAFMGLLGLQGQFGITYKGKTAAMPYRYLWPQIIILYVNLIAFIWGINRFIYEENISLLINCFWTLFHFSIMLTIFYFNSSIEVEK